MSTVSGCDVTTVQQHYTGSTSTLRENSSLSREQHTQPSQGAPDHRLRNRKNIICFPFLQEWDTTQNGCKVRYAQG